MKILSTSLGCAPNPWAILCMLLSSMPNMEICETISLIDVKVSKESFFGQCTKMQLITLQNFNIQPCFSQFLWLFSLKFLFKSQIISRIHLILPNAYKLMCFDRNSNGNRDVKFFEWDYWSLH